MKIGIEAQRLFRREKHGMDVVALETLRHLQRIDSDHEFIVFVRPGPDTDCLQPSANMRIQVIEGSSYPVWEQIKLPHVAEQHGVDLLHCTSNTAPLVTKLPVVLTLHDTFFLEQSLSDHTFKNWYNALGNQYRRWVAPEAAKQARRIITISQFARAELERRFSHLAHRIAVNYNGVSERFGVIHDARDVARVRQHYGLPKAFIFALGSLDPRKNLARLVAGYHVYRSLTAAPIPLVLAGISRDTVASVLPQAARNGLLDHILFPGYIPDADLPLFYVLAKTFLFPSLKEGFGLPILEAMRSGTPVVTSTTTAMPEVAGDAAYLTDPRSEHAIGEALHTLLLDEKRQRHLACAGQERADSFSWANTAARLVDLYESCAHQPTSPRIPVPQPVQWMHA